MNLVIWIVLCVLIGLVMGRIAATRDWPWWFNVSATLAVTLAILTALGFFK